MVMAASSIVPLAGVNAETSPSADMIEAHRAWMEATGHSDNTITDACELLYRVDRALAEMQREAGEIPEGLAGALEDELVAWLRGPRNKKWSRQTRKTYRDHLVRCYRWAVDGPAPWLSYDPSAKLKAPKVYETVPQPASDDQVAYLEANAKDPFWLHLMLAARQGFRPSDVANARREHFAMKALLIDDELVDVATVRVRGKGDKPAILPCDPLIWQAVRDLPYGPIAHRPDRMRHSGPVTAQHVASDTWFYLHRTLKMPICMRSLRAWYATTMLNKYKNPRVVQELMRHSSLTTLQRYTAVTVAQQRAAVLDLPRFGGRSGEVGEAVDG